MNRSASVRDRTSSSHGLWRELRQLLRPDRRRLVVVALLVLTASVAGVAPPFIVRHVIDANVVSGTTKGLAQAGVLYLMAIAVVATCSFAYNYVAASVAQRAIATLRVRLFAHLTALPTSYLDDTPVGDTISRATSDVETIDTLFTDGITTLVGQLFSALSVAIAMVILSARLSAVSLVVIPPLLLLSRALQRRLRAAERSTRVTVGQVTTQLSETLGGRDTIRAFHRQEVFTSRLRQALRAQLVAEELSVRFGAFFTPITALLSSLMIAALLWTGSGGLFHVPLANVGTLTAFILLFQSFFAPLVALGDQWNAVQAALAGTERVFAVLALPIEPRTSSKAVSPIEPADAIVLRDVQFSYREGSPVLRDISFTVRPGEHVVIVGRTGSGKTTLLSLLAGLYSPESGEISLAGHNPHGLTDEDRRKQLGVVPQRVEIFSATLRDNVTLGDTAFDDDAVSSVLNLVGLDELMARLPAGLNTHLLGGGGGDGTSLSSGERQLLALARALLARPTVLLFDEATAAIDSQSETVVRAALRQSEWSRRSAMVSIAHRISTARDADRVLVMEEGRIIEQGSPAVLLASGGPFAAMADLDDAGWQWEDDARPLTLDERDDRAHSDATPQEDHDTR